VVIPPVYIGPGVTIKNAVVGPKVSIGANTQITDSVIENSIVQSNSSVSGLTAKNSLIGHFVKINIKPQELSLGDYNEMY
jgi:glucose-1-phosphate thymidylyltransferase